MRRPIRTVAALVAACALLAGCSPLWLFAPIPLPDVDWHGEPPDAEAPEENKR